MFRYFVGKIIRNASRPPEKKGEPPTHTRASIYQSSAPLFSQQTNATEEDEEQLRRLIANTCKPY